MNDVVFLLIFLKTNPKKNKEKRKNREKNRKININIIIIYQHLSTSPGSEGKDEGKGATIRIRRQVRHAQELLPQAMQ